MEPTATTKLGLSVGVAQFVGLSVGVAQFVGWLLPTPEIRGLNPVIADIIY